MTQADCNIPKEVLEHLAVEGFEALPEAIRLLLNLAMVLERQQHLNADPYERSEERQAHANGFKRSARPTPTGSRGRRFRHGSAN